MIQSHQREGSNFSVESKESSMDFDEYAEDRDYGNNETKEEFLNHMNRLESHLNTSNIVSEISVDEDYGKIGSIDSLLNFSSEQLEDKFLNEYFFKYRISMQSAIFIGTLIWTLFGILDIVKEFQGLRTNFIATIILRAACCVIGCVLFGISVAKRTELLFRKHMNSFLSISLLTFGISQIIFGLIEGYSLDPTYSVMILFLCSISSNFFRLRFFNSISIMWILWLMFAGLTVIFEAYDSYQNYLLQSLQLLKRMLPLNAIKRLRFATNDSVTIVDEFSNVTILFSKITDFDSITNLISPKHLIVMLNHIFITYDNLTRVRQAYKVETIGDVYMCCAGCPVKADDHAETMCELAIDMMNALPQLQFPHSEKIVFPKIQIQLGLNSGKLYAGVVGARYRLMGNSVNIASRMSTTALPGQIQISPATYQIIKNKSQFEFTILPEKNIKGCQLPMKCYQLKSSPTPRNISEITERLVNGDILTEEEERSLEPEFQMNAIVNDANIMLGDKSEQLQYLKRLSQPKTTKLEESKNKTTDKKTDDETKDSPTSTNHVHQITPKIHRSMSIALDDNNETDQIDNIDHLLFGSFLRPHFTVPGLPNLESDFLNHYTQINLKNNRKHMIDLTIGLFMLSIWETVCYSESYDILVNIWIFRSLDIFLGLVAILMTFYEWYRSKMEFFTVLFLVFINAMAIQTHIITNTYENNYAVTVMILFLSFFTMYFGLRFFSMVILSVLCVISYFFMILIETGNVPSLSVFFCMAIFFYCKSGYDGEFIGRKDFFSRYQREEEEKRSKNILNKLLPAEILEEMRSNIDSSANRDQCISKSFDSVSVLFSDIKEFTKLSGELGGLELVQLLNTLFAYFDKLMNDFDCYKVETIGDAYLCSCGLVGEFTTDHPRILTLCALAMLDAVEQINEYHKNEGQKSLDGLDEEKKDNWAPLNINRSGILGMEANDMLKSYTKSRRRSRVQGSIKPISIRIGIHTGPVYAGVVGKMTPRYHLFGETVSIAEEIEAKGIEKHVIISSTTYERIEEPSLSFQKLEPLIFGQNSFDRYKVLKVNDTRQEVIKLPDMDTTPPPPEISEKHKSKIVDVEMATKLLSSEKKDSFIIRINNHQSENITPETKEDSISLPSTPSNYEDL